MTIRRIAVGLDGSETAHHAAVWAADLARVISAEVLAIHAIPTVSVIGAGYGFVAAPELDQTWQDEVQSALDGEWSAPFREAEVPYRTFLRMGGAAVQIMDVAEQEQADLVVAGRRGRGGFAELVLGSVSHQLAHHTKVPVVIVPLGPER